jgi:putative toxin-antitoxin system antitoxin component (TIGR02293 family)
MAKSGKIDGNIRGYGKRAVKVDKSSGKFVRMDPKTSMSKDSRSTVYGGVKISNPHSKGLVKETKGYHAGSVLMQSAHRPENRMTTIEKMEATRKGITKKELEQLKKKAGLDYDQLSYILHVARATLIGKKGTEKFGSLLSEKIMSLADIYSYGYEVFGSEEEFNKWIFQPVPAFGGKSPYQVMDNQYGREEVKHVIGRIEHGVYS